MVDLVEFSVVDITKGRMDIQLCGHGRFADEISDVLKIKSKREEQIR